MIFLLLNQLVYTSFPGVGFKLLASPQVPPPLQQVFLRLVHQHWDAYHPPQIGYRAAYIYQLTAEHCLFGWLYNNKKDDIGRSHTPYFHCYHLAEPLQSKQLDQIFLCLQQGPVKTVEQYDAASSLQTVVVSEPKNYRSAYQGVTISSQLQTLCHRALEQKKLLNLFVAADQPDCTKAVEHQDSDRGRSWQSEPEMEATPPQQPTQETPSSHNGVDSNFIDTIKTPMITGIDDILQDLSSKPIGIQGAVLVSSEGQPITTPIGMSDNSALVMAGMMLYLATSTCEEFSWSRVENISIRGQEGYIVLSACTDEVYLLVKAGKALSGLLEGEINRTVKKLQTQLSLLQKEQLPTQSNVDANGEASLEAKPESKYSKRSSNFKKFSG